MAKKKKKGCSIVKTTLIFVILAAMIVGFYCYLSMRDAKESEDDVTVTKSQQVLMRNLETSYPPSPKEVVKYYCDITQCFYNESHTEAEVEALAMQIRKLYDAELAENQTEEEYLQQVKLEVLSMASNGITITSYGLPSSTDVKYFSNEGYEWARLYCTLNMRQETKILNSVEQFLLRKDEDGRWKIYGWELAE